MTMTAQHTPGPWRLSSKFNEVIAGPNVDPVHIATLDLGPFGAKDTLEQPGDVEANARLIAAAPELLDALTRILAHAKCATDDLGKWIVLVVKPIITKAEGREP